MALRWHIIRRVMHPVIADRRDLATFVILTTLVCLVVALSADVTNQLVFFEGWPAAFRSWSITGLIVLFVATPVSWSIGRAHLELYLAKNIVDKLSLTDPLTGLPNRRAVFEVAERTGTEAIILVIFDIDRFKRVNDTHGHLAGDEVIRSVAQLMADELGSLGFLGRIGGEEFMLVCTAVDTDRVVAGLSAFRKRLAETPLVVMGATIHVTMSAGAAVRKIAGSLNELYAEADRALYTAKSLGRNRITYSRSFEALLDRTADRDEAMWRDDTAAEFRRRATDNREGFSSVA